MPRLILLRHGQSVWNQQGRFSGWGDPPLSGSGVQQALAVGRRLAAEDCSPDSVFCSRLTRARQTLELALWGAGADPGETSLSWRLNERHCGQWEGMVKRQVSGPRLSAWRDQDQAPPPLLALDDPRHPRHDPRYRGMPETLLPSGESYADLRDRLRPLWRERIVPSLHQYLCVWVVAHAGSLRALAEMALAASGQRTAPKSFPSANALRLELTPALRTLAMGFLTPAPP